MACRKFREAVLMKTITPEKGVSLAHDYGTSCVMSHAPESCSKYCSEITKDYKGCFDCIGSGNASTYTNGQESMPLNMSTCTRPDLTSNGTGDNTNIVSCCRYAEVAISCSQCVSKNSGGVEGWNACLEEENEYSKWWIIGGSIFGAILIISLIAVVVRSRRKSMAKEAFSETLKKEGVNVDKRVLNDINSGKIDSSVLESVRAKQSERFSNR